MYEVKVREMPARSLLCLLRHASNEQEVWDLAKEVIGMFKAQPPPRVDGVAGAAFRVRDWPDQAASLVENGGYSDASG